MPVEIIKAITVHQPWAQMIALGAKEYETRSWTHPHRGKIAIHAGKTRGTVQSYYFMESPFYGILTEAGYAKADDLPYGAVIAFGDLVGMYHVESIRAGLTKQELALGNFEDGRAAWKIENIRILQHPILSTGKQGIWDFEYDHETG